MAGRRKTMKAHEVLNKIVKKALVDAFGESMAASILMSARTAAGAPILNISREDLRQILDAMSRDERVVSMWDNAGVRDRIREWINQADEEQVA